LHFVNNIFHGSLAEKLRFCNYQEGTWC